MDDNAFDQVVKAIADNYEAADEIFFAKKRCEFPSRREIIDVVLDIRRLMFPGYFGDETLCGASASYFVGSTLSEVRSKLVRQLKAAFLFKAADGTERERLKEHAELVCEKFIERLPHVQQMLLKDVQAAFDGDPAASSKEDIIYSYPGFFAIFVYRIAHELYVQDVPLIPRIITEYAHGKTGVDINAGAEIGEYFFIDHATGVVIGETCRIGSHVKLYQGVTLGALSTRAGQQLRGVRRHPTICDDVTIYSNASVLGGETVVGKGAVIGGSAFVTSSVPENGRVSVSTENQRIDCPHSESFDV